MRQVYLIGGGPGTGKSTIAQALSKRHGFEVLKADILEGSHRRQAADEKYPVNNYLNNLSDKERPLELIRLSTKQELARHEELFFMLLKELRAMKFDNLIIEGNSLLPDLVRERFEFPCKAVWLLPTLKFQSSQYIKRDWALDLILESEDPTLMLHNWVRRDYSFNQEVIRRLTKLKLPYLLVDGKKDVNHSIDWAEKNLDLTKK